jgi:group I intron endonuclease
VGVIYKTTNLINGKFYVGKDSKNNPTYLGSGILLNMAIKKYGREHFIKEILEFCETEKHLCNREVFWIEETKARELGYNIAKGGHGGSTYNKEISERVSKKTKGRRVSQETIDKIQTTKKERLLQDPHAYDMNDIQKKALSNAHSGKTLSEEHKKALRQGASNYHKLKNGDYSNLKGKCGVHMKGRTLPEEHRKKISEGNFGKKMSEDFVEKTRQRMTGEGNPMYGKKKPHTEEHKQSIRGEGNPFYGCTHTDETKKKMSESRKNKTPEQKLEKYIKFYISRTGKEPTEEQKRIKYEEYLK